MIDLESADLDAIPVEDHAFGDFMGDQFHAVRRIATAAHPDIDVKHQWQMLHHLYGSYRPPHRQRRTALAPGTADPTGAPEIGKADQVIRMMMGKKHAGDRAEGNTELMQPLHSAAAGVEDEYLPTDFDQSARPEAIQARRRRPGARESHAKDIVSCLRHAMFRKFVPL